MYITFLFLIAVLHSQPASPTYAMQTTATQRIEATLTVDVRYPKLKAAEWVLIAPQAPELAGQRKVTTLLEPAGAPTKELSPLARPVITGRVGVKGAAAEKEMKLRVIYRADLLTRKLVPLKPGEKASMVDKLTDDERKPALRETELHNFNDKNFQSWLTTHKLRRQEAETEVDFARRVFLNIQKNFKYEYKGTMDRHAANVCTTGRSDCGGMSIVFVSALRVSGVPARVLVGRWAIPGAATKPTKIDQVVLQDFGGQHAVAEFYAHGVGWVPVDPSAGVVHDKSAAGLDFFGRSQANFLTLHIDEDLMLDSIHFGRQRVQWMQSPVWWVTGQGTLDKPQIKENWQVKKLP